MYKMLKFTPLPGELIMRPGTFFILGLVFAGVAAQPARSELVTDGSFAANCAATSSCTNPPYFTYWAQSDDSIIPDNSNGNVANSPPDEWDAEFTGSGILSQSITTTAGQAYTLSFSVQDASGLYADTFTVDFGSFTATITGDTAPSNPYTSETFTVPGSDITGASTLLSFQGSIATDSNGDPIGGNWYLDDVSIDPTGVPEPPTGALLGAAVLLMLIALRTIGRASPG
jgi:hypothetical protein